MASAKVAQLVIRTLAKPISNQIKVQAKEHETFRNFCVNLAQRMHRVEVNLRTNLLGEPARHVRPLSETRAIESGANALAEGFLFSVAAGLIIGEAWRSSRNQSKRRDSVDEALEDLQTKVFSLTEKIDELSTSFDERISEEKERTEEITRILGRVVEIGLRGGMTELEASQDYSPQSSSLPNTDTTSDDTTSRPQ
ncbi:unnamed protein product [Somion occarium]|uniref:OPA3-domain-containing protein n=1 Tax=Somion occarium TaxID=3059160 RepID=A0ABP1D5Q3_9APHY